MTPSENLFHRGVVDVKWNGPMEADGTEYLEYSKRQTQIRTGADPRNVRAVKPKAFAAPNGPPERDPVAVYKIYSEKRPDAMNKPDAPWNKLHKKSFVK